MAKSPQTVINENLGKSVEVEDPSALDQCMDWAFKFVDEIGVPGGHATIRAALARNVINTYDKSQYDLVSTPTLGCLVVWDIKVGFAGHIAVFESGTAKDFVSADQNWEGVKYVRRVRHNNFGVIGFLRPKVLQSNQGGSVSDSDLQYRENDAEQLYLYDVGRVPTRQERQLRLNEPWSATYPAIVKSPEANTSWSQFVIDAYQGYLFRNPDQKELGERVNALRDRKYTAKQFIHELLESQERKDRIKEYGIKIK